MDLQVGVKILLQNNEGSYLLLRRSPVKYPGVKDAWDIVGGRIDPGTPLLENLEREVLEETGLRLQGVPTLIAAQDIILRDKEKHIVRLTYLGNVNEEDAPRLSDEHEEYHWFSKKELGELPALDKYLKELLANGTF